MDIDFKIPRFPLYNFNFNKETLNCKHETVIRKQKDGVWYDFILKDDVVLFDSSTEQIARATKRFISTAYNQILFIEIEEGRFEKSPIQISEEERISNLDPTLPAFKRQS